MSFRDRSPRTDLARRLRRQPTDAESALWRVLRAGHMDGTRFRRQQPIGPYVVDLYCASARLAIELDGDQHAEPDRQRADEERTAALGLLGVRVLRFANHEVLRNLNGVLEVTWEAVRRA